MRFKLESQTTWNVHKKKSANNRKQCNKRPIPSIRFAYIKTEIDKLNPKVRICIQ